MSKEARIHAPTRSGMGNKKKTAWERKENGASVYKNERRTRVGRNGGGW